MAENQRKLIARRFIEILDHRELDRLGDVLSDQVAWHGTGGIGSLRGVGNYREILAKVFDAFPDSTTRIDILLAEQDKVAIRYTVKATHQHEFLGFPATERKVSMATNMIVRIEGEKIQEIWHGADPMGLMMANYRLQKEQ